jgi:hypothetical protein
MRVGHLLFRLGKRFKVGVESVDERLAAQEGGFVSDNAVEDDADCKRAFRVGECERRADVA